MIRVMVVDDHPIVRAGIVGLLDTEPDFEVVAEAESGEQAIELVPDARPDVVLMDLRMPGMGGVEATRRIAAMPAVPRAALGLESEPARSAKARSGSEPVGSARPGPTGAEGVPGARGRSAQPVRVLVFTTYEDDDQILAAIEAGAGGYLVKAAPAAELAAGVRAVAAGQTVLAPSVAAALAMAARGRAGAPGGAPAGASGGDAAGVPAPGSPAAAELRSSPRLTAREIEIVSLVAEGLSNPEIAARLFIGESTVKTHLLHVFEKLGVSDRTRAVIRAMELGLI